MSSCSALDVWPIAVYKESLQCNRKVGKGCLSLLFFLFVHFPWLIRPIPHEPAELAGLPDTSVSYVGHYIPILGKKKKKRLLQGQVRQTLTLALYGRGNIKNLIILDS